MADPATLLQTLGAITPGIAYGRTRLQPGLALGALGQVYGNVQQQQQVAGLASKIPGLFQAPPAPGTQQEELGAPGGPGPASIPSSFDRIQALAQPQMSRAQWFNQMSPQEKTALIRTWGTGGIGGGTGTTTPYSPLVDLFTSARNQAETTQKVQLKGMFGQALEQYRQNPNDEQALQTLTQLMPHLGTEERTALQEIKGFRERQASIKLATSAGHSAEQAAAIADSPLGRTIFETEYKYNFERTRIVGLVEELKRTGSLAGPEAERATLWAEAGYLPEGIINNASKWQAWQQLVQEHPEVNLAQSNDRIPMSQKDLMAIQSNPRYGVVLDDVRKVQNESIAHQDREKQIRETGLWRQENAATRKAAELRGERAEAHVERYRTQLEFQKVTEPLEVEKRNGYNPNVPANKRTGGQNDYTPEYWQNVVAPIQTQMIRARQDHQAIVNRVNLAYYPDQFVRGIQRDVDDAMEMIQNPRMTLQVKQQILTGLLKRLNDEKALQDPKVLPNGAQHLQQWQQQIKEAQGKLQVQPPGPGAAPGGGMPGTAGPRGVLEAAKQRAGQPSVAETALQAGAAMLPNIPPAAVEDHRFRAFIPKVIPGRSSWSELTLAQKERVVTEWERQNSVRPPASP